jgi:hypothetical protein
LLAAFENPLYTNTGDDGNNDFEAAYGENDAEDEGLYDQPAVANKANPSTLAECCAVGPTFRAALVQRLFAVYNSDENLNQVSDNDSDIGGGFDDEDGEEPEEGGCKSTSHVSDC